MPDPLFQNLFTDTARLTWAPTEVVRERARRRVWGRRRAALALAVVAVGAISGGVAATQRGRTTQPGPVASQPAVGPTSSRPAPPSTTDPATPAPPTSPPSTQAETTIVDAQFLQPDDVDPGYRFLSPAYESGDWTFEFSSSMLRCPQPDGGSPTARRYRYMGREVPGVSDGVTQYVARFRPGDAGRYLDEVRARVAACNPVKGTSMSIVAQRFAGQDSLIVAVDYGEGSTTKHVLVRQGDLLTEFVAGPERSTADTQELGRRAAVRLCEGTPAC